MKATEPLFTLAYALEWAGRLSPSQRSLFDHIWKHFTETKTPFPMRSLPLVSGRESFDRLFDGLNGGVIYETTEQGNSGLKLTVQGALLTKHGQLLGTLLVRLLDLVRERYEGDVFIKEIGSLSILEDLGLSDEEGGLLFSLLRLSTVSDLPFYLSGYASDGSWTISITDEVIALYRAEGTGRYLDERLAHSYQPGLPWCERDRLGSVFGSQALACTSAFPLSDAAAVAREARIPYVASSRIDTLRAIDCREFDCTRLLCLCEELNDCAASSNAHAVIFLTRAILDHVPPVFGFESFAQVASNYQGGKSLRRSLERLENQSRHVADRLLHMPIRHKELAPLMEEVSFSAELECVLAELCRRLK